MIRRVCLLVGSFVNIRQAAAHYGRRQAGGRQVGGPQAINIALALWTPGLGFALRALFVYFLLFSFLPA